MSLRRFVLITHRWIGLGTSVVLGVAGATGALMVWGGDYWLKRVAGLVHETLALGRVGEWLVLAGTAGAILLQIGGVYLWWKRTAVSAPGAPGWRRTFLDLHQAVGGLGLWIMLALAATGVGLALTEPGPLRRTMVDLHSGRRYSIPVKALYAGASLGFLVQGVTGVLIWWRPRPRR